MKVKIMDFSEIENSLQRILSHMKSDFPSNEHDMVREFIDHGEYGLALEEIVAILSEEGITPNQEVIEDIKNLSNYMGVDL